MTQTVSGFTVPAGSDPVSSIDDTLVTFAGEVRAAINAAGSELNVIDAKGDLVVGSADNTPARLAVGTDGYILQADSASANGVKWAANTSAGGKTLLSTTTLSGASTLISSISGSYKELIIEISDYLPSTGGYYMSCRVNDDSTTAFHKLLTVYGIGTTTAWDASSVQCTPTQNGATARNFTRIHIPNYASTSTYKMLFIDSITHSSSNDAEILNMRAIAAYRGHSAAVSSIRFLASAGTFAAGTVKIYGVN